ncbi:MAG TPA: type II secretion system protein GspN, partial [Myxococcales bacterium]|nr:type II secretion system protein GspN [Myxococcales bacterium]
MSDAQTLSVEDIEFNDEGPSRLQKTARWSGYGLFFLVALLVSLILNFPNRQLKGFIEGQARKAGYPLAIESLRLSGLSSMTIKGVKVTLPAGKAKPGKPGLPSATLRLDEVNASTALWPLITRSEIDATLDARLGGGSIQQGRLNIRQGPSQAQSAGKKGRNKKKGKVKGRSALLLDIDIPSIEGVDLQQLGISSRMLGFTTKVGGALDGTLSGSMNLHWEGRPDGAKGNIDLELTDALLRSPTVAIDAKGPPLALQDLRLGVLTLKVRIDEKGRINLLKSKRGVDSATAIHLAGVDIFGPDIELVAEERSHII